MSMKSYLIILFFCFSLSGFSQNISEIPDGLRIPPDSMASLQKLAAEIAQTNQLTVKSIEILWEIAHPGGRPGARIYFEEQHLGDDVYEFARITVINSNWHKRVWDREKATLKIIPPASTEWATIWDLYRSKRLKMNLVGKDIFVEIGPSFTVNQARLYIGKFITWVDENPSLFKHSLDELGGVWELSHEIQFSFPGFRYCFKVTDEKFVFTGAGRIIL